LNLLPFTLISRVSGCEGFTLLTHSRSGSIVCSCRPFESLARLSGQAGGLPLNLLPFTLSSRHRRMRRVYPANSLPLRVDPSSRFAPLRAGRRSTYSTLP